MLEFGSLLRTTRGKPAGSLSGPVGCGVGHSFRATNASRTRQLAPLAAPATLPCLGETNQLVVRSIPTLGLVGGRDRCRVDEAHEPRLERAGAHAIDRVALRPVGFPDRGHEGPYRRRAGRHR